MLTEYETVMELWLTDDDRVQFVSIDDDTGSELEAYWLRRTNWRDFGSPGQITVSVQAGDRLSVSGDSLVLD